jgi:chromosome segregation ATPase
LDKLDVLIQEKDTIERNYESCKARLSTMELENENLKIKIRENASKSNHLETKIDWLEGKCTKFMEMHGKAEEKCAKLHDEISQYKATIENLKLERANDLSALEQKCVEVECSNQEMCAELELLKVELASKSSELCAKKNLEAKCDKMESHIDDLESQLEYHNQALHAALELKRVKLNLEKQLQEKDSLLIFAQKELKRARAHVKTKENSLNENISKQNNQKSLLQSKLTTTSDELAEKKRYAESLRQEMKTMESNHKQELLETKKNLTELMRVTVEEECSKLRFELQKDFDYKLQLKLAIIQDLEKHIQALNGQHSTDMAHQISLRDAEKEMFNVLQT